MILGSNVTKIYISPGSQLTSCLSQESLGIKDTANLKQNTAQNRFFVDRLTNTFQPKNCPKYKCKISKTKYNNTKEHILRDCCGKESQEIELRLTPLPAPPLHLFYSCLLFCSEIKTYPNKIVICSFLFPQNNSNSQKGYFTSVVLVEIFRFHN